MARTYAGTEILRLRAQDDTTGLTRYYDVREKLADYQERSDYEIWYIHPRERTLTAWRRKSDGSHAKTVFRSGLILPEMVAGAVIDIDALFSR